MALQTAAKAMGHPLTLRFEACVVSAGGALSSSICHLTLLPWAPCICVFSQWIVSMVLCAYAAAQMPCVSRGRMLEVGFSVNQLKPSPEKTHKVQITSSETPGWKRGIPSAWCAAESCVLQLCSLPLLATARGEPGRQRFAPGVQYRSALGYFSRYRLWDLG